MALVAQLDGVDLLGDKRSPHAGGDSDYAITGTMIA
jgi:hypothetical protein